MFYCSFNGVPAEERLHWRSFLVKLGADNLKGVKNEELLVASHKYEYLCSRGPGKKGVWIKLPIGLIRLVETTVKEGFRYHHAEPSYLMLVFWIPKTPGTILENATHRVGVGSASEKKLYANHMAFSNIRAQAIIVRLQVVPMVTTESGLQYKDIKVGEGPSPPVGFQPTTIANCFWRYKIRFEKDMLLQQKIGDVEGIHKLKEVISDLHYRNVMDVEQILNYPSENEPLKESLTDEEIIQEVMDVPTDDEQYPDDNNVLPYVSPKEAFLAVECGYLEELFNIT
ncbi:hypothetical protein GOBAR_DD30611 [Gossypium barbadense]|nr:hypothetical protein GOBAR_DD30611 [Gossypium barbadense]